MPWSLYETMLADFTHCCQRPAENREGNIGIGDFRAIGKILVMGGWRRNDYFTKLFRAQIILFLVARESQVFVIRQQKTFFTIKPD